MNTFTGGPVSPMAAAESGQIAKRRERRSLRTRATRTACHGYSGENFDQLRRDQKGQRREGERERERERKEEGEKLVRLPLSASRIPSRTKVQTNLFDPPNEKRLGCFPNLDSPTTIPPSDSSSTTDQIFSQPKLPRPPSLLPSFLLPRQSVHCSRIWRGSNRAGRKKGRKESSLRSDARFSAYLFFHYAAAAIPHHNICAWGRRRLDHNECS